VSHVLCCYLEFSPPSRYHGVTVLVMKKLSSLYLSHKLLCLSVGIPLLTLVLIFTLSLFYVLYDDATYESRYREAQNTIGSIHLTQKDADGTNLPPIPNQELNDSTVEGIDTNQNHIRDDVEHALFTLYPIQKNIQGVDTNFKERAAALQYAQAMQIILTLVGNKEEMRVADGTYSAAYGCLKLDDGLTKKLENLYILNTKSRKDYLGYIFRNYAGSSGEREKEDCDL
jgi:hypothetical protein